MATLQNCGSKDRRRPEGPARSIAQDRRAVNPAAIAQALEYIDKYTRRNIQLTESSVPQLLATVVADNQRGCGITNRWSSPRENLPERRSSVRLN